MSVLDEFGHDLHVGGRHGQQHGRVSGCVVNTGRYTSVLLAVLESAVLSRIKYGSEHGRVGGRVAHKIDIFDI